MSPLQQRSSLRRLRSLLTTILVIALLMAFAASAWAAPQDQLTGDYSYGEPSTPSTAFGFFSTLFRLVVSLAIVLGLFYGGIWLYRRFSWSGTAAAPPSQDAMRVIGGVSLGAGRFVQMVQIGERVLLVGSADGGVSNMGELSREEAASFIDMYEQRGLETLEPFEATLFRLYSGWQESETRKTTKGPKGWAGGARDAMDNLRQKTVRK